MTEIQQPREITESSAQKQPQEADALCESEFFGEIVRDLFLLPLAWLDGLLMDADEELPEEKESKESKVAGLDSAAKESPKAELEKELNAPPEAKTEGKSEAKTEPKPEAKTEPKPEAKTEPKPEAKPEPKTEGKPEPKPEAKTESRPESPAFASKKLADNFQKTEELKLSIQKSEGMPKIPEERAMMIRIGSARRVDPYAFEHPYSKERLLSRLELANTAREATITKSTESREFKIQKARTFFDFEIGTALGVGVIAGVLLDQYFHYRQQEAEKRLQNLPPVQAVGR